MTAGNASGIGDGAASVVIAHRGWAEANGATPIGRLVSWGFAGVDPSIMGIGPAPAARAALAKAGLALDDMDLVEINEAFAAQYKAVEKELRPRPGAHERERRRHRDHPSARGFRSEDHAPPLARVEAPRRPATVWVPPASGAGRVGRWWSRRSDGGGDRWGERNEWGERMSGKGTLSRRDFDEVMRRASELARGGAGGIGGGVHGGRARPHRAGGRPGRSSRCAGALREFRSGGGRLVRGRPGMGALLESGEVRASRTVARPARAHPATSWTTSWWAGNCCSGSGNGMTFFSTAPRSTGRRAWRGPRSSTSRQHYVAASRQVEVRLEDLGAGSTQVEIVVDPGMAGNYRTGALLGGGMAGAAAGLGVGAGLALMASVSVAALGGVAAGLALAALVARLVARGFQRRLGEVHLEVEGILDGLEDDGGLEPPPPAWRRWVRRHFHGVAREMMGKDDY